MTGQTVLVVEDDQMLQEILVEWLVEEGYTVFGASNGAEALEIANRHPLDVVATDVRMPVMDGLSLLEQLHMSTFEKSPTVILMSGYSGGTLRDAYHLGVEDMLAKPFTDLELLVSLQRVLMPREKRWGVRPLISPAQELHIELSAPDAAREQGLVAFGRGGFCLRSDLDWSLGPVTFDLGFANTGYRLQGQGWVRWADSTEAQIGVEVNYFHADCLPHGIALTARGDTRSFIPRSSQPQSNRNLSLADR